jgi:hypothetical protein
MDSFDIDCSWSVRLRDVGDLPEDAIRPGSMYSRGGQEW